MDLGPVARAEDDDPFAGLPDLVLLSQVTADPDGEAVSRARAARHALGVGDDAAAAAALGDLIERHTDTLVPTQALLAPGHPAFDEALHWPSGHLAMVAIAGLESERRAHLLEPYAAAAGVLAQAAAVGDAEALARLAFRFSALPEGRHALAALAHQATERGALREALRAHRRLLLVTPADDPAARTRVTEAIQDLLRLLPDAGGTRALATQLGRELPPRAGPVAPLAASTPTAPGAQRVLWEASLDHGDWLSEHGARRALRDTEVRTGGVVAGQRLLVHEGRRVHAFDLTSGIRLWTFPGHDLATLPAPEHRVALIDRPWRSVTLAGDRALVVLGEPGGDGTFRWLAGGTTPRDLGHELRLRLACLDLATGTLLWTTGAHDETHPVLGAREANVTSPALVEGDAVYVTLALDRAADGSAAACLDLASGAVRWVRALGVGESGRSTAHEEERYVQDHLTCVRWGSRPRIVGSELLVHAGTGFAAGLDKTTGHPRWLRRLPRYHASVVHMDGAGHSPANPLLPWGDAWVMAPQDCPRVVCLEAGTGMLRWHHGRMTAREDPLGRHLHDVVVRQDGIPVVRVMGDVPLLLDARDGGCVHGTAYEDEMGLLEPPGTRGSLRGDTYVRYIKQGRHAQLETLDLGGTRPQAIVARPLPTTRVGNAHVLQEGAFTILLGTQRIAVLAPASWEVPPRLRGTAPAPIERARAAVLAMMRARTQQDPEGVAAAWARRETLADTELRTRTTARLGACLVGWLEDPQGLRGMDSGAVAQLLRAAEPMADALAPAARARLRLGIGRAWHDADRPRAAVAAITPIVEDPREARLAVPLRATDAPLGAVRADLVARTRLSVWRSSMDATADAVLAWERDVERALETRFQEGISLSARARAAALREPLRVAAGTMAAWRVRRRLARQAQSEGARALATGLWADARLDLPASFRDERDEALVAVGRAQAAEALAWHEAHELDHARSLVADLEIWAPETLRDGRGRTPTETARALAGQATLPVVKRSALGQVDLPVWGDTSDRDLRENTNRLAAVQYAGLHGPGANLVPDRLLVVRGLTPEIWSASERRRLAALPGRDEGWFGGHLMSVDRWVPGGGVFVTSVVAREPADRSLIQPGDWVRSWGGLPTPTLPHLMRAVALSHPGDWTDIEIRRGGVSLLDRFRAGRRPIEQSRRLVDVERLWCDRRGRVLVPARTALAWIDRERETRTPCWSLDRAGLIEGVDVVGGEAYVRVMRQLEPDVLVRVDLATGKTLWAEPIEGDLAKVEISGSAVVVHTELPSRAWILDRETGSVRAWWHAVPRRRGEFARTLVPALTAGASPAGRLFVVSGLRSRPELLSINTTTGELEWSDAWMRETNYVGRHEPPGPVDPWLSADSLVGVIQGPTKIRLVVPDPLGEPPDEASRLEVADGQLRTEGHGGSLGHDTRIALRGRALTVLRNGRTLRTSAWIVEVDLEDLRARLQRRDEEGDDPLALKTQKVILADGGPGGLLPYLGMARIEWDGVLFGGTTYPSGKPPYAEVFYLTARGRSGYLARGASRAGTRPAPVRSGDRLVVPADLGARFLALERLVPDGDE